MGSSPDVTRRRRAAGLHQPCEDDDAFGRRIQRMAGGEDQAVVRHALRHPDGGRRHDPRALDAVGEAAVGHRRRRSRRAGAACRSCGTGRRRSCGARRCRPSRAGRAAACRDSGRGPSADRPRPCPRRSRTRGRCGRSQPAERVAVVGPAVERAGREREPARRIGQLLQRALLDRGRRTRSSVAARSAGCSAPRASRARTAAPATAASRRHRSAAACPRRSARSTARAAARARVYASRSSPAQRRLGAAERARPGVAQRAAGLEGRARRAGLTRRRRRAKSTRTTPASAASTPASRSVDHRPACWHWWCFWPGRRAC